MNAETTYVNEFIARGIVLEIGRNAYHRRTLTLLVQERRNNTLKLDINLDEETGRDIRKKDRVLVTGYIRGFFYHNDSLGKDSEVMYFAGTTVEKEQTELTRRFGSIAGPIGTFYPEPVFRSYIAGKVIGVEPATTKKWAKLTVETSGGGNDQRASRIVLRYYDGGRLPVFDYQIGDVICARLSAFTPEKETREGHTVRFQNVNVEDIAYLFKVPRQAERTSGLDVDYGMGPHRVPAQKREIPKKPVESFLDAENVYADDTQLFNESL